MTQRPTMTQEPVTSDGADAARPKSDDRVAVLVRVWLPILILSGAFAALVRKTAGALDNPDTYFHLRIGHEFLHSGWAPWAPGQLTSYGSASWAPTQWLSQVVMAAVDDRLGLPGVAWLCGLLFVCWGAAVYAATRQRAGLLVSAVLVPLAVFMAGATGLSMRPQVASYAATALTMVVWQRARTSGRPPWLAVALTWAWAMLHGMWPVGIVIGLAACLGIALDRRMSVREAARWFAVPVVAMLAAGCTPVGPRLYGAVLLVSSRSDVFSEWAPPDFTTVHCLIVLALIAVTVAVWMRHGVVPWFDLLMLLVALGWAVYTSRTIPVAATMLAPLAGSALQRLIGPREPRGRVERFGVLAGAVVALVGLALAVPHTVTPLRQPSWVPTELGEAPAGTRVVTEMTIGSQLLWLYPNIDPIPHGYGDVYTDAELERVLDFTDVKPGWQDDVRSTGARLALLDPKSQLAYALETSEHWTVLRHSKHLELLQAPPGWSAGGR